VRKKRSQADDISEPYHGWTRPSAPQFKMLIILHLIVTEITHDRLL